METYKHYHISKDFTPKPIRTHSEKKNEHHFLLIFEHISSVRSIRVESQLSKP